VRQMRLRNHRERRTSHLSNVQDHQLENPRDTNAEGAEMTQATKDPKDEGGAQERAQRELTASVGTPLMRPEKSKKRRLFGGRRKSSTSGS
jgi:hypothetical protein